MYFCILSFVDLPFHSFVHRCQHYFCETCAIQQFRKSRRCYACGADTEGTFKPAKQLEERLKGVADKKGADSDSDDDVDDNEEGQVSSSDDEDNDWAIVVFLCIFVQSSVLNSLLFLLENELFFFFQYYDMYLEIVEFCNWIVKLYPLKKSIYSILSL